MAETGFPGTHRTGNPETPGGIAAPRPGCPLAGTEHRRRAACRCHGSGGGPTAFRRLPWKSSCAAASPSTPAALDHPESMVSAFGEAGLAALACLRTAAPGAGAGRRRWCTRRRRLGVQPRAVPAQVEPSRSPAGDEADDIRAWPRGSRQGARQGPGDWRLRARLSPLGQGQRSELWAWSRCAPASATPAR